jgi:class 3 adenylate cyclase/tetratricopeptide (TPR) repeat protein
MRCPNCNSENREGCRFCAQCGRVLVAKCQRCGASNEPGEKFCGQCGASLASPALGARAEGVSWERPRGGIDAAERVRVTAADDGTLPDGERKTVTALFADIKGSTELEQDLDPEEARAIVDPALKLMIDAVRHYDGYIVQSTGDGIFALFGAPIAHEDHSQRALHAALRMQEELRRYSARLVGEGGTPIETRIGVNTGEVVVRALETGAGHAEYTPIGHTTNLASRMQAIAPTRSIAISEQTRKLVEGYFQLKSLGLTKVKGVSEPVNVYEVTGLGPLRTRLQRSASRGLSKFVGRQREIDLLKHAAEQTGVGHGQIVAAMAEPGVGKTRLFYEFKATSQSGWMVLETFSVSHGKASAFLPVIELLHGYFKITSEDDTRTRREKVTGRVLALDRALEDTLPYLFGLLGIVEGEDPLAQMDAQIRKRRTLDAIKRILLRESLNQPLMVEFEDLHWIDDETQALLNLLADSIGTAKILLLVNYRPEYHHEWGNKTYYTQLRLDPLGKESAEEMLASLIGEGKDLIPLKRLIIEKTEGTPFFMEETVEMLLDEGALVRNGTVKLTRSLNQLKIPPTVQDILASRIDRLPPDEKNLLQTLAVIGMEFPFGLVQRVAAKSEDELNRMLHALQLAEFIYEQPAVGDVEYIFKHALTHDVAYNSLLMERRKALHERTANAIEELYSDRLEDHLAELAHHYGRSANVPKAVDYLDRAGEQARRRSAYTEAIAHFRRGIELIAHLPQTRDGDAREARLQNHLAVSLVATRGYAASEAGLAYLRAKELSERIGEPRQLFGALVGLAAFYAVGSDVKKARDVGQELLRMASAAHEPVALLAAYSTLSNIFHELGDFRTSLEHADNGLKLFDAKKRLSPALEHARLICFSMSTWALLNLGYPDQALARANEALNLARHHAYPFALAVALFTVAGAYNLRGDNKRAQEHAEMLLALTRESGFAAYEGIGLGFRGQALVMQGQGEEGLAEFRRGIAILESIGQRARTLPLSGYAASCWKAGKVEEGLEAIAIGLALGDQIGSRGAESGLYRVKGELLLMKEPPDESAAESCFKTAIDIARSRQAKSEELRATTSLARLFAKQGKRDEARAMLAEIYGWFSEGFDTADLKDAKALLDELSA